ncbi:IS66 family insertion sequence element accessory protein TnpB [bacterium]|nr:IS66 family insertion sequence element accessory protein TnpB [bacterium]
MHRADRHAARLRRSEAALARDVLQQDPLSSSHLFVFGNKRADRVKILYWDRSGFCLWYKRIEGPASISPARPPPCGLDAARRRAALGRNLIATRSTPPASVPQSPSSPAHDSTVTARRNHASPSRQKKSSQQSFCGLFPLVRFVNDHAIRSEQPTPRPGAVAADDPRSADAGCARRISASEGSSHLLALQRSSSGASQAGTPGQLLFAFAEAMRDGEVETNPQAEAATSGSHQTGQTGEVFRQRAVVIRCPKACRASEVEYALPKRPCTKCQSAARRWSAWAEEVTRQLGTSRLLHRARARAGSNMPASAARATWWSVHAGAAG